MTGDVTGERREAGVDSGAGDGGQTGRPRLATMLLAPLLGATAVGTVGLGLFIHRSVEQDLIATVDDELTRAILVSLDSPGRGLGPGPDGPIGGDRAGNQAGADGDGAARDGAADDSAPQEVELDADGLVVAVAADSTQLSDRDLSQFAGVATAGTVDGDPRFRALSRLRPDGTTTVVGVSLAEVDRSLASLRQSLVVGAAVLLTVLAVIAAFVVRSVNRPIMRLTRAAHRIADG